VNIAPRANFSEIGVITRTPLRSARSRAPLDSPRIPSAERLHLGAKRRTRIALDQILDGPLSRLGEDLRLLAVELRLSS